MRKINLTMQMKMQISTVLFCPLCRRQYSWKPGRLLPTKVKKCSGTEEVLEVKDATKVMKKTNWENQELFGKRVVKGTQHFVFPETKKVEKSILSTDAQSQKITIIERGYKKYGALLKSPNSETSAPNKQDAWPPLNKPLSLVEKLPEKEKLVSETSNRNSIWTNEDYKLMQNFPLLNPSKVSSEAETKKPSLIVSNLDNFAHFKSINLKEKVTKPPSVTTVLKVTMPESQVAALERWKQSMIAQLGEEGFKKYQLELLNNGTNLHDNIAKHLEGLSEESLEIAEGNSGHWKSLKPVFPCISDVKVLEKYTIHPYLHYSGVIDCIALFRDQLLLIDWKTSKKPKKNLSSTFDGPLQLVAYLGAANFDNKIIEEINEVSSAALVIAYESGEPADVHTIPFDLCNLYWKRWLKRLSEYWKSL